MSEPPQPRPTPQSVTARLARVSLPPTGRDLVALGLVRQVEVLPGEGAGAVVRVDLTLPGPFKAQQPRILTLVHKALEHLEGVDAVELRVDGQPAAPPVRRAPQPVAGVRHLLAVGSGKGGVGKTTVAVNLAVALARRGLAVGLLDADVYGPNVPTMLGLKGAPNAEMVAGRLKPRVAHGVKVLSVGLLGAGDSALAWRGPLLAKMLHQLLFQADWAPLDLLVIDLPPGTGDVPLTLVQAAPLSGAVVVATPQDVALEDAVRALGQLRDAGVPILGVVENMAFFACPQCGHEASLFGRGGAQRVAAAQGVPFLGELPLVEAIRAGSDTGRPAAADPALAPLFEPLATQVVRALEALAARPVSGAS
ncbi:MAG TPA: P-loop NTPase [Thermodesulfobacteriota bacterium]|nr:P-loop NTPase [Thermodesulfobacteriota bacterium]